MHRRVKTPSPRSERENNQRVGRSECIAIARRKREGEYPAREWGTRVQFTDSQ